MARIKHHRYWNMPRSAFACPDTRNYPLIDRAHVANAAARYAQRRTVKCSGGAQRICKAASRLGMKSRTFCKLERGRFP